MKKVRIPLIVAGVAFVAACTDQPVSPPMVRAAAPPDAISVLSWNIYVGTDVDAIIWALMSEDPGVYLPVVMAQLDTLGYTYFPARAAAIADEIAAKRPHAVGLQEVTSFDLSAAGLPPLEFLPILMQALTDRGLNYEIAGSVMNIDASVEILPGQSLGMQDFDVMLIDADRVTPLSVTAKQFDPLAQFADNFGPVGGVELRRGYVAAALLIGGEPYAIVSTHLEPPLGPNPLGELREGQAMEIAWVLGQMGVEKAIVMGDLNDASDSPMMQVFASAGLMDAWPELRPGALGYTCCHLTSLRNTTEAFTKRIDYVLVRGIGHPEAGLQGRIDRLGEVSGDRVTGPVYPIWPSDHAGLFAEFVIPEAVGLR